MGLSWGYAFLAFCAIIEIIILIFIKLGQSKNNDIINGNAKASEKLSGVLDKLSDKFDGMSHKLTENSTVIRERLK